MIIFNTLKKAEHYVKYCNENIDYDIDRYDWANSTTYIEGKYVKRRVSGDGCGCGCDNHLYDYIDKIGRIKSYNEKSTRDNKIKQIIDI